MQPYKNQSKRSFQLKTPLCKGQRINFEWSGVGGTTFGFAEALEDFKRIVISKKESKYFDTEAGVYYVGEAMAYYN